MAERQSELNTGSSSGASPEQIRDDIRRTRANMDETVDAIGERLRPRHLLDDVLDLFRSGDSSSGASSSSPGMRDAAHVAKDLGANALQKMKNHPMPAALIGAGLAWLLFDGSSSSDGDAPRGRWRDGELREHSGSYVDARTGQPYDPSYGADYAASGSGDAQGPGMLGKAADTAKSVGRSVASAGSSMAGAASGAAGRASSATSEYGRPHRPTV